MKVDCRHQPRRSRMLGLPPEQQNVKAVSTQHCAATSAPRSCCLNCCAEQNSECFIVEGRLTHYKWYDYEHAHTTYTKQLTNNTKQTDKTIRNRHEQNSKNNNNNKTGKHPTPAKKKEKRKEKKSSSKVPSM